MGLIIKYVIAGTAGVLAFIKGYNFFTKDYDEAASYSNIDDAFLEDVDPDLDD